MISQIQEEKIVKLKRDIFKIIYGFDRSYKDILEEECLDTLRERRQKLFDDYVLKSAKNDRYRDRWFPTKTFEHADLRKERIYVEKYARTDRLMNSPLYQMRKRLNEIGPSIFE